MDFIIGRFSDLIGSWSPCSTFLRLAFSAIAGIIIGIDREIKNRSAGVKTHALVSLGACLVMLTGEFIYMKYKTGDPARLGAQVISGIGFLGAGTIITTRKNQIKGITTAAGIWGCACIGLAAGIGYMWGAVIALVLVVFTLKFLAAVDRYLSRYTKALNIYVEFESTRNIRCFLGVLHDHKIRVTDVNLAKSYIKGDGPAATMTIHMSSWKDKAEIMDVLQNSREIIYYEIL